MDFSTLPQLTSRLSCCCPHLLVVPELYELASVVPAFGSKHLVLMADTEGKERLEKIKASERKLAWDSADIVTLIPPFIKCRPTYESKRMHTQKAIADLWHNHRGCSYLTLLRTTIDQGARTLLGAVPPVG